ncbi:MAG: hypothetical protein JSS78_02500 [Bacteroidetes bacterium]|nr:hypothetical protein [Bacteroidota bacterium]
MKKNVLSVLLLLGAFVVTFTACKKITDNKYGSDLSRGYYPLQIGKYVVYDVDSIIWDDFRQVKTLHKYQMRYTVADTFFDNTKRLSYRLDVDIRNNDTFSWTPHRVIEVTPTTTTLEYKELNLRFIKMIFPVANALEWKGNSLIPSGDQDYTYFQDWTYRYSDQEKSFNNGKVFYDNTITVNEVNDSLNNPETMPNAYAYRTFAKEVYGYNVGMVYREVTHWTYDGKPNMTSYRRGYSVVMRAVDNN